MKHMKLNKKAQFFNIILVIIAAGILTTALFILGPLTWKGDKLGEKQSNLINKYQEAEKTLFYIDQSAILAAQQAVYDLANNGGFYGKTNCNQYLGYNLWDNGSCYPDYNLNFKIYLTTYLNPYFEKITEELKPKIVVHQNNHEISLIQKDKLNIIGTAIKPILITEPETDYTVNPSFNIELDYNINDYQVINQDVLTLLEKCSDKEDAELNNCIETNLPENWSLGSCSIQNRVYCFDATSSKQVLVYNKETEKVEYTTITYKFAIKF